jgi:hypothetical protein
LSQAGILTVNQQQLPPEVPTSFVTNSGIAVPSNNTLHVLGGADITVSGSGDTVTITYTGTTNFTWQTVTSTVPVNPIQLVSNNGYICNGSSLVTFLLPLTPNLGDSFIVLSNTARFQITENGSQQICIGTSASTAGSGNVTSNSTGDQIEFVYVGGNIFRGFAPQGTLTLN